MRAALLALLLLPVPLPALADDDAGGIVGSAVAANRCVVEETAALEKRRAGADAAAARMQLGDFTFTLHPRTGTGEDPADNVEFITIGQGNACLHAIAGDYAFIAWARPMLPEGPGVGEAAPLAILSTFSGGAHCCTTLVVVWADPGLRIQEIPLGNSEPAVKVEWPGAAPRLLYGDDAFAYWNSPYAGSPGGDVILDWSEDGYRVSETMRVPAPGEGELESMAEEIRIALVSFGGPYRALDATGEAPTPPGDLNPVIWADLLKLAYGGNAHLAGPLFDRAWPPGVDGKRAFWRDFVTQMHSSVIWKPWNLGEILDPEMPFANGG